MTGLDRRTLLAGAGAASVALPLAAVHGATPARAETRRATVRTGADVLAADGWRGLSEGRIGVFTNPTGILQNGRSIVDEMHESGNVDVVAVFGPEHGFRGTAQAGESEGDMVDPRTGIMVYDAYGANATSLAAMYREAQVDTVVFDIQDVGARFYTYIWSMYTAMVAAADEGVAFTVLDRPNPIGGTPRGPMMTPEYTSGVGAHEIIQAHGMTVGELARFFNADYLPRNGGATVDELTVVEMEGWRRDMLFEETGLLWVLPSPNMPTPDTALLYIGTCLFEGTNLSEGRGTTRPFELIGAPYVDHRWAEWLTARELPGVLFREAYFNPLISKNAGVINGGVQVHITDPEELDAIRVAVEMLIGLKELYPEFQWRYDSWDTARPYWIDKLTGSPRLRNQIDQGASADTVISSWKRETAEFASRRRRHLIYR
ncbi:DUF1343 domain-containing protein [Auraticoccus sp. F435]|uniref:DUF1343 domain-containing protein n=1 Tax=Auraticoccus cholistanensis TaxID=2656650 RepID=A0A6A9UUV3_9ACTN|nr:DUF1343 domain-containing protein [Auraticoccus cholistanensis]MVA75412.1 DUF1343 domain-containing protein [Auraticoccus cholistanensis]